MRQIIKSQIQNINDALGWVKKNRPNDYAQKFLQLVEYRKVLKQVAAAEEDNPGIAAFGKSQVGKSYLISCLLQDNDGNPYMVEAGDTSYNFVYDINPPSAEGGATESTGVVSRFSSFSKNIESYNVKLPVLVKTLSLKDLVLIISDSYYNDVMDFNAMGEDEIKELCKSLEDKYSNSTAQTRQIVTADDVLIMNDYFKRHINNAQSFWKTSFFTRLALVIENIPAEDYVSVFANLWHNDPNFTMLFKHMYGVLQRIDFAHEVYLPIESVLHGGIHENTIMSVQCLNQLFCQNSSYKTDVYVKEDGKYRKVIEGISKSDICAICAEVVFRIGDSFLQSSRSYSFDEIPTSSSSRMNHNKIEMSMLEGNDLLDFPGARSRLNLNSSVLSENKSLLTCLLRGKVAYIFNKYNEEMRINILLFCHHNKDNDVTYLYKLLEDWVNEYVGSTPQERADKLKLTGKSPLFFIGTMFNLDMKLGPGEKPTSTVAGQRWFNRFEAITNKQVLNATDNSWVKNWTAPGEDFRNAYVLRDYKFSKDLYDGFLSTHRETSMLMQPGFYEILRNEFIESQYIKQRFADPEVAWDASATRNNDGSLYIMENLQDVAACMDKARSEDFNKKIKTVCENAASAIDGYHVSDDKGDVLKKNIRKARSIFREMDFTCNDDNYYFGHLIQAIQLDETVCYRTVHSVMHSPDINTEVNTFKDYEIIRQSCANSGYPLNQDKPIEEQWQCVIKTYGFESKAEADVYLKHRNVDSQKLFSCSYKRKMNSYIIGDAVYAKWCEAIKSVDFLSQNSGDRSFDTIVMGDLIDGIVSTAEAVKLSDHMAETIAEYVNVVDIHTANESLLADLLASTINDFVLDFGYSYLNEDEKLVAEDTCRQEKLPVFNYINKESKAVYDETELTTMFNNMSTSPMNLLPSFEDNYNRWIEYMFISFVAHLNLPKYDHEANEVLEKIIVSLKKQ